jgi:hypothetical protein
LTAGDEVNRIADFRGSQFPVPSIPFCGNNPRLAARGGLRHDRINKK